MPEPVASPAHQLPAPAVDLAGFTDLLSEAWGVGTGVSAAQYVKWSEESGILAAMAAGKPVTAQDLCRSTSLSADGIDSLIPVLMALGIVAGGSSGYNLTTLGKEYFLAGRPYYVGPGLFWNREEPIPDAYLKAPQPNGKPPFQPPAPSRMLPIQLSRNLAPSVCAVRTGRFQGVRHLVDIGGGAGAIAIPFALDNPSAHVTLVDLPAKIEDIRAIIRSWNLEARVTLLAADVLAEPWRFGECDGILFGNFFHVFGDDRCRFFVESSAACLPAGARIWLHEVLFHEDKSGPMIAALWNANMHVIGGRQRTASEFRGLLEAAGFTDFQVTPTAGRFSLIEAVRRAPGPLG